MDIEKVIRLAFDNTVIDTFTDRHIHILDCDIRGTMTLTNAFSRAYLGKITKELDIKTFDKVYLYHTDGYISEWRDGAFWAVTYEHEGLFGLFKGICVDRRSKTMQQQYSNGEYYLIDLERSVGSGMVHYWKPGKRGYTRDIKEAGLYSEENAVDIEGSDFDHRTVKVHKDVVNIILEK